MRTRVVGTLRVIAASVVVLIACVAARADAFELRYPALRFFEPDMGVPVTFDVGSATDTDRDAVATAMASWNAVPCSSLRLQIGTSTSAVRFDDPSHSIVDPAGCR